MLIEGPADEQRIASYLQRQPKISPEGLGEHLTGKSILVTGAGGYIGRHLCVELCRCQPSALYLAEISDHALTNVYRHLKTEFPQQRLAPFLIDIGDWMMVSRLFREADPKPEVVFDTAAYKFLPILEQNVLAAIKNNTLATNVLLQLSKQFFSIYIIIKVN